jgi:hypothetical protein
MGRSRRVVGAKGIRDRWQTKSSGGSFGKANFRRRFHPTKTETVGFRKTQSTTFVLRIQDSSLVRQLCYYPKKEWAGGIDSGGEPSPWHCLVTPESESVSGLAFGEVETNLNRWRAAIGRQHSEHGRRA